MSEAPTKSGSGGGTPVTEGKIFRHGVITRQRRSAVPADSDNYPRIVAAYGSSEPGNTSGMLLVRNQFGTSNKSVDFAAMDAWFSQHHEAETFTTDGGKRVFDLERITPPMLRDYFLHEFGHRRPSPLLELGHLVDPTRVPGYASYVRDFKGWPPAIAAGITQPVGSIRVEKLPDKK